VRRRWQVSPNQLPLWSVHELIDMQAVQHPAPSSRRRLLFVAAGWVVERVRRWGHTRGDLPGQGYRWPRGTGAEQSRPKIGKWAGRAGGGTLLEGLALAWVEC
jgi:hypothetical protein